jgi:hypothetical protein
MPVDDPFGLKPDQLAEVRRRYGPVTGPIDMRAFLAIVDDVKAQAVTVTPMAVPEKEGVKG